MSWASKSWFSWRLNVRLTSNWRSENWHLFTLGCLAFARTAVATHGGPLGRALSPQSPCSPKHRRNILCPDACWSSPSMEKGSTVISAISEDSDTPYPRFQVLSLIALYNWHGIKWTYLKYTICKFLHTYVLQNHHHNQDSEHVHHFQKIPQAALWSLWPAPHRTVWGYHWSVLCHYGWVCIFWSFI